MTSDPAIDSADPRWLLSALADGEADDQSLVGGCAAWAEADSSARQAWHAYHLIGDVLRSDDLASPPVRDRAFLARLRARLADEPVPMALAPALAAVARPRRAWALPLAMAASLMALATGLVLTLGPPGDGGAPATRMAEATRSAVPAAAQQGGPVTVALDPAAQGSRIVRDAQLDRYLRAHREYGTDLPGSLPGGAGRSVTAVSFDR